MSMSIDPLKTTAQELHRFWFEVGSVEQWYEIMRECRIWFGKNWRCMPKVRRKFNRNTPRLAWNPTPTVEVWFDVPDPGFATWISVKHSLQVRSYT